MDADSARALTQRTDFVWHQRWPIAEGVVTPGTNDIPWLLDRTSVPERLDGLSVLDIGTTNGAAAFIAEQRGASRVVAVDIYPPSWFGFDVIADALGSKAEFVQSSVYDLTEKLTEQFDVVFFYGVLYHLRHPLLAIDAVRSLTRGTVFVETAICDRPDTVSEFYAEQYRGDSSNWFVPSASALVDWFTSSGWAIDHSVVWPEGVPSRGGLVATPVDPPYLQLSYEVPLTAHTKAAS